MIQIDLTEEELMNIIESVEDNNLSAEDGFNQIMIFQSIKRGGGE